MARAPCKWEWDDQDEQPSQDDPTIQGDQRDLGWGSGQGGARGRRADLGKGWGKPWGRDKGRPGWCRGRLGKSKRSGKKSHS